MLRPEAFGILTTMTTLTIILIITTASITPVVNAQPISSSLPPAQVPSPLTNLYKQAKNSIVQITTTFDEATNDNSTSSSSTNQSSAINTGFVYDKDGHILTSTGVILSEEGNSTTAPTSIYVTFASGNSYSANIPARDPYSDLAVLQINNKSSLLAHQERIEPLPLLSDSSALEIGQPVAIIGNPFGLSFSLTSGLISGLDRIAPIPGSTFSIPGTIQINGILNPGDSGPVLNMDGKVVGIMSMTFLGNNNTFSGIGFAIPSNTIKKIVPQLIANGTYKHPTLGVAGPTVTPAIADVIGLREPRGFLVADVIPGSAAAMAGLHGGNQTVNIHGKQIPIGGDVIIGIDNKPVKKIDDLLSYVDSKYVNDTITLKVLRDGMTEKNIVIKLAQRHQQVEHDKEENNRFD
jgi:S1-C subfamily serine protease